MSHIKLSPIVDANHRRMLIDFICIFGRSRLSRLITLHLGLLPLLGALVGGEGALALPYTIELPRHPCCAGRASASKSRSDETITPLGHSGRLRSALQQRRIRLPGVIPDVPLR